MKYTPVNTPTDKLVVGNVTFTIDTLIRPQFHEKFNKLLASLLGEFVLIFEGNATDHIIRCKYLDPTRPCGVCDQFTEFRIIVNKTAYEICLPCLVELLFFLYPGEEKKAAPIRCLFDQLDHICKFYERLVVPELNEGKSAEKQGYSYTSEIIISQTENSPSLVQ